ncbi:hypothetical protein Vi05172_g11768 [Venturia inaequalis]|nr:hypothetical protein Vi05172_g11768 [Venturia inaequalis]
MMAATLNAVPPPFDLRNTFGLMRRKRNRCYT